jgi:hypothetical protein
VAEGFPETGKLSPTPQPPPIKGGGDNEGTPSKDGGINKVLFTGPSTFFEFIDMDTMWALIHIFCRKGLVVLFSLLMTGFYSLLPLFFEGDSFFSPSLDGRGLGGG